MRYVLIAVLVLMVCLYPVSAQESGGYRLREISAEEYLRATPAIIDQGYAEGFSGDVSNATLQEFRLRFGDVPLDDHPFALLQTFQEALVVGQNVRLNIDERAWFLALFRAGLRDEAVDDFSSEFAVGDFHVTPTPVDFDADGMPEFLLEIDDHVSGRRFYASRKETVRLLPLPMIGLHSDAISRALAETGQLEILQIADLDRDGGSEIVVAGGDYGYWASCDDLYVLDWQDGEVVNRADGLFHYCAPLTGLDMVAYGYAQPDAVQMTETRVDGWNCQRVRTDTLDLPGYTLHSITIFADTVWCALREASDAFDNRYYERAAEIYRQIIPEFEGQMAQYLYARLALAYALDNQPEQVQTALNAIEPDGQMGVLLSRLREVSNQPEAMCLAAHDFFAEINYSAEGEHGNPYDWTPPDFYFGHEAEDPRYFPLPVPAQAGCDYQSIAEIEPTAFPTPGGTEYWQVEWFAQHDAYAALLRGEYQHVLAQVDTMLALPEADDRGYSYELTYIRAITLELMARTDEALAEYVALYEAAPESAWGMLAALHLEPVEP
jgi:tetratricopeptide (TPR) repeat protein